MVLALLSILIAYLFGSISSSCIVGRIAGNYDVRKEPDGHISAAVICYRIGMLPSFIAIVMDFILAALAVVIAMELTDSTKMMMLSGLTAMIGHNWSVFLKFKGGLGATSIAGAMLLIMFWPLLYGFLAAGVVLLLTQKPGLSTALGIVLATSIVLLQESFGLLAGYPLALFGIMIIKKIQVGRLADPACQDESLLLEDKLRSGVSG